MANLGNLFYSLYLKDMTDEDIEKIKKNIEKKFHVRIGYDIDEKAVDAVFNKYRETGKTITENKEKQTSADNAAKAAQDSRLKQMEREARILSDIEAKKEKAFAPVNQALGYSRTQSSISLPYESASYRNAQNQLKSYYQEEERAAKATETLSVAMKKVQNQLDKMNFQKAMGGGGNYLDEAISKLDRYRAKLVAAQGAGGSMKTNAVSNIRSGEMSVLIAQTTRLAAEQSKLNAARKAEDNKSFADRRRKEAEESRNAAKGAAEYRRSVDSLNSSLSRQGGLLGQMRNELLNVYSIYTLKRFATSLIEIGGEFQKQHIALKAILGDAAKADVMYEQIKQLAVESPFNFKELMGYTKQIAAFSIPYKEMYDTTKRLADISAGLGVDMGRIILAYGQVRSASFLRGQEVRQFTEAGIPLLDELAKKFTQLEDKVVSVGDVFDKISKREVPFQMVKDVLWELTDEGGKFYNMQEVLAESLSGKLSNLKDAYEVMLADMAQANSGILGGSIDMLSTLTKHWRELLAVITPLIAAYGSYKTMILLVNAAQKASFVISNMQAYYTFLNEGVRLTKSAAVAQWALNSAMKANPAVIIASVIAVLVGATILLWKETKTAAEITSEYNSSLEKQRSKMAETASAAERYIHIIKSDTALQSDRLRAYQKLQELMPDVFKSMTYEQVLMKKEIELRDIANKKLEGNRYIHAQTNKILAEKAYNEALNYQRELIKYSKKDQGISIRSIDDAKEAVRYAKLRLDLATKTLNEELEIRNEIKKGQTSEWRIEAVRLGGDPKEEEGYEAYLERLKGLMDDLNKVNLNPENKFSAEIVKKNNEELEKTKKIYLALGGVLDGKKGNTEDPIAEKYQKELDLLKDLYSEYKKYVSLQGEEKGLDSVKADKRFTSLFEKGININDIGKEIDNIISKLNTQKDKQGKVIQSGLKFKAEIDKDGLKKSTDEALKNIQKYIDDTTKKWDLFKSVRENTGNKEFAMQLAFGELSVGETDMLKDFRKRIEEGIKGKGLSFSDALQMDEASMKEAGISAVEPLVKAYNEGMIQLRKDTADNLTDLVTKYKDYGTKIKAVEEKLQSDLNEINSNSKKYRNSGVDVNRLIAERRKQADEEIAKIKFEKFKDSDLWAKTFEDLERLSTSSIDLILEKLEEFKNTAGKDLPVNEFKELMNVIKNMREEIQDRNPFKAIADGARDLKEAYNEYKIAQEDVSRAYKQEKFIAGGGQVTKGVKQEVHTETTKTANGLKVEETVVDKLIPKYKTLNDAKEETVQADLKLASTKDQIKAAFQTISGGAAFVSESFDVASSAAGNLSSVFDILGNSDAADVFSEIQGIMSGAGGIASGFASFASGDILGGITSTMGGITGIISSIAQAHDNKLNKAIERSQRRVEALQTAYDQLDNSIERSLGGSSDIARQISLYKQLEEQAERAGSSLSNSYSVIYDSLTDGGKNFMNDMERTVRILTVAEGKSKGIYNFLGGDFKLGVDKEALEALKNAGVGKNLKNSMLKQYQSQYIALVAQRKELEGQLRDEEDKKKTDSGKVQDYQNQLSELNEQIRYFVEDLTKELYGIDFDDWAGQISDALTDAFANGEDAAVAFDNVVNNILKNIANNILKNLVIAPMMDKLQEGLFGDKGIFKEFTDIENNGEKAASFIKEFFSGEGKAMMDASEEFLEAFNKATGGALTATGEAETGGLSKGIQGVSEDTANLLGSYLNSIRQDVSVKRVIQEKFFNEDFPKMSVIAQAQLQQLNAIADNTARNADFTEDIRDMIDRCYDRGKRAFRIH